MNKKTKWGIIALIGIGLAGMAIHTFLPRENKELAQAPKTSKASGRSRTLNVIGEVIKESSISDGSNITGLLLPDEEVNLSFETSGKITAINFTEGTHIKKGELLAKVNDAQLQAQLRKLEVQLKLAEDRVYRQNALLEREAVSKEAYEQVQTDLAMLKAAGIGVAMINGSDEVKAVADYITTRDNNHDGVAEAADKFFYEAAEI